MDKTRTTARILIVEDDGIIACNLQRMVAKLGYEVVGAVPSGEEAIQKAKEERPSLVLMDVSLAGKLNGVEAAVQIQARSNVPVIFLTGYARDVLFQGVEVSGSYIYLNKPVYERALGDAIEEMFAGHTTTNGERNESQIGER